MLTILGKQLISDIISTRIDIFDITTLHQTIKISIFFRVFVGYVVQRETY